MKLKLLIVVLALQTAWILGTTVVQERALAGGTVITLETALVDPRDMLRGDYLTLNYKISTVNPEAFQPPRTNAVSDGQAVYVALEPRGQFYEIARASTEKFLPAQGQVVLKGRVRSWWGTPRIVSPRERLRVEYGLERYYVREGTGHPAGKLTVQAAVSDSGQGHIKQVLLNGIPYIDAMRGIGK